MTIISLIIILGIPFLLLFSRKRKWNTTALKQYLLIVMLLIGATGFFFSSSNESRFLFYSFLATPIYIAMEQFFTKISIQKYSRDFKLWLNYSDDVDGILAPMSKQAGFKLTDILFSIILLLVICGFAFLGAVLFGKEALYNK
ncbi:MAG: hypothetical protein H6598_02465 [Flavobacteriales bacterium]|nr:hypothetical protein [Flavobacteriales bacterium]